MTPGVPGYGEPTVPARVGPYRLVDVLGSGGMGDVFRAWDERLKRWVAVKLIRFDSEDPHRQQRFRREAQATAVLNHPTIVRLYDVLETEDGYWIVMEHVEGQTLATLIADEPLTLERGLALARQIAAGLAEAHSRGILHRDLKTENVMVTPAGGVKILDFGLAKRFSIAGYDPSEPDTWKSVTGRIVGTSRAMSPEQAQGLQLDGRSDLFALGTLCYEMFTGVSPFKGYSHIDTLNRVCTHHQPPAAELRRGVPEELSELIDGLLEKDPRYRPQSADEVVVALDAIVLGEREVTDTVALPSRSRRVRPRAPESEVTRAERPLPPGGLPAQEEEEEEVEVATERPFWRRFTLPPALAGLFDSFQFLRDDSSES